MAVRLSPLPPPYLGSKIADGLLALVSLPPIANVVCRPAFDLLSDLSSCVDFKIPAWVEVVSIVFFTVASDLNGLSPLWGLSYLTL